MPHVPKYAINGHPAPSVNNVTDLLPKPWLLNWYNSHAKKACEQLRNIGGPNYEPWVNAAIRELEFCDKRSKESRELGTDVHEAFEIFLKKGYANKHQKFITGLETWLKSGITIVAVEPHIESLKYEFHGSPDLIAERHDSKLVVYDYKIKERPPDFKTILNETGYAICWNETHTERIEVIGILRFHPETGKMLTPLYYDIKQEWIDAFLLLREALKVAKVGEKWDKQK